jgi:hypothetical protein
MVADGSVTGLVPVHDGLHDAAVLELDLGDECEVVDGNDAVVPDDECAAAGRDILKPADLVTVPDPLK